MKTDSTTPSLQIGEVIYQFSYRQKPLEGARVVITSGDYPCRSHLSKPHTGRPRTRENSDEITHPHTLEYFVQVIDSPSIHNS